ncbi:DNA-directed RNA polymerase subunit alpha C-terminal domain-containing protein [Metabacillus rhizolycopersici]|uniref:RNA polymerase alpha subunit C-terminal domain-containing protein n=1 Tax=Metabacillus rhizolycopersici TaxID=2875709 RepID=A0ABS7UTP0_9BACI|nr:DNA-directed RNA polymerase subunit alpha C-terminal domain-containing protein [Metabacillus rhizolycopersici]MBZ5751671.1 hypothetical protein [Metabacillus rhizolycopersici]
MATSEKNLRICSKGHKYYKSSYCPTCPTCPTCGQERKPDNEFLSQLSGPARGALEHNGITTLQQLSKFSEKEILKIHGIGPASLPTLRAVLKEKGLSFEKGFLSQLSAPARRALESNEITTLQQLSKFSEKEILQFHGIGSSSLPKLKAVLKEEELSFEN